MLKFALKVSGFSLHCESRFFSKKKKKKKLNKTEEKDVEVIKISQPIASYYDHLLKCFSEKEQKKMVKKEASAKNWNVGFVQNIISGSSISLLSADGYKIALMRNLLLPTLAALCLATWWFDSLYKPDCGQIIHSRSIISILIYAKRAKKGELSAD